MESLAEYADALGPRTSAVWPVLAGIVPDGTVLMGGTALAIRVAHRRSEDLNLFTPHEFDPDPLHESLNNRGNFVLSRKSPGHLHGTFDGVKVDILWNADATILHEPTIIAGLPVGSIQDVMATKLRAITDRHILRDYFDVMCIEQLGPDLRRPVDPEVLAVHPSDVDFELLVAQRPRRRRSTLGGPIRRRGEQQRCADRLDPEATTVLVDEGDHRLGPSSWAAKKADADFRISFARRNSQFSRSNCLSR